MHTKYKIYSSLRSRDSLIVDIGCKDVDWLMRLKANTQSKAIAFTCTKKDMEEAIDMFYADIDVELYEYSISSINKVLYENPVIDVLKVTHLPDQCISSLCSNGVIINFTELILPVTKITNSTKTILGKTHTLGGKNKTWEFWYLTV